MLAKQYRLTERNTKKVLHKGKPFFSYGLVLNLEKNNYNHNRFAIIIGGKSVKNNIHRNFFRRKFYDIIKDKIYYKAGFDMVFLVKQKNKLDMLEEMSVKDFTRDLNFLMNKI